MKNLIRGKRGFTITEILIVALLSTAVIGTVMSAWTFIHRDWKMETEKLFLRMDLLGASETIQKDIRLSSATYMVFYPAVSPSGEYTAVSMPLAKTDADGYFTLNASGDIAWDSTVVYHLFAEDDGTRTLRRTELPWDSGLDYDERYDQVESIIGAGGSETSGAVTDENFMNNVDDFYLKFLPDTVDFYADSLTPQREGKVVFGWALIGAGNHQIRFEVTDKNSASSGYGIGIDRIMLEPCGSWREAEYYDSSFAPEGSLTSNGRSVNIISGSMWDNNNYLEYRSASKGDYIEFEDYYDLWRESAFDECTMDNTLFWGEDRVVKLELPEDRDPGKGKITWYSYLEAGAVSQDGSDGDLPDLPITIRTIVSNSNLYMDGDLVRVKFMSSSQNPLRINEAYITRRKSGSDGYENKNPSGLDIPEYHMHQKLFFKDTYDMDNDGSTDDFVAYGFIEPDSEVWTEWSAFPLIRKDAAGNDVDYFITFYIPDLETAELPSGWSGFDPGKSDCRYWSGSDAAANTYYYAGDILTEEQLSYISKESVWIDRFATLIGASGYWSFDDIDLTGDVVLDKSGNGNNAVNHGAATGQPGISYQSFSYDGVNDYVDLGIRSFGKNLGRFTISFWINTTDTLTARTVMGIINDGSTSDFGPNTEHVRIDINTDEDMNYAAKHTTFSIRDTEGNDLRGCLDPPPLIGNIDIYDGNWHHIVWKMLDAPTNNTTMIVDNVLETVTWGDTENPSAFLDFDYDVILGALNDQNTNARFFKGSIDEMGVWYRELTSPEITQLYTQKAPDLGTTVTPDSDTKVYISAEIDTWSKKGSVESRIYDTFRSTPSYNQIRWSEDNPSGTEVRMKARSSDSQFMDGATAWSSISGSISNPGSLSMGGGRFFQFYAELSTDPYWAAGAQSMTYPEYIAAQLGDEMGLFPGTGDDYLVTALYSTWIDDVQVDWPGNEQLAVVSGYIARKNDYGKVKVTVDGMELIKGLEVEMSSSRNFRGKTVGARNNLIVEPRNTGR
ncbi:MAG: LamG-like jellyroll fold domain-containing protein [Candidatus Omnitrophota bacterium]